MDMGQRMSTPETPKFGNGLVQLIRMENSTGQYGVIIIKYPTYLFSALGCILAQASNQSR